MYDFLSLFNSRRSLKSARWLFNIRNALHTQQIVAIRECV